MDANNTVEGKTPWLEDEHPEVVDALDVAVDRVARDARRAADNPCGEGVAGAQDDPTGQGVDDQRRQSGLEVKETAD